METVYVSITFKDTLLQCFDLMYLVSTKLEDLKRDVNLKKSLNVETVTLRRQADGFIYVDNVWIGKEPITCKYITSHLILLNRSLLKIHMNCIKFCKNLIGSIFFGAN